MAKEDLKGEGALVALVEKEQAKVATWEQVKVGTAVAV